MSDLSDLVFGLATINLGYLASALAIFAILAGVFYFFNVKPLSDSIEKQRGEFNDMKGAAERLSNQVTQEIDSLDQKTTLLEEGLKQEITNSVQAATERISKLEKEAEDRLEMLRKDIVRLKLTTEWNAQYMWRPLEVQANVFTSLLFCLEDAVKEKAPQFSNLCINQIHQSLSQNQFSKGDIEEVDKERLYTVMEKVSGFEKEKTEIKNFLERLFA